MLNKLFGGKKRTSAAEGRTNPSPGRHGRPKYASFCMPEWLDNPPLGRVGPPKSISFSMPERSNNPPLGRHGPANLTSFSTLERSDNPPLGRNSPAKLTSFSMPERSDNPPLDRHGPREPASVPGQSDNSTLGRHGPPKSASFSVPGRLNNPPLDRHGPREPAFVPGRLDNSTLCRHGHPKSASFSVPGRSEIRSSSSSSALKIIHVGGVAEYYYMATPASRILNNYPSFILAKPEVFRKPWDSVVHKDEILIPGQKYYLIPKCTLKKLRRRIKKNNHSFISQSSQDSTKSQHIISIIKTKTSSDKNNTRNRRVRFFGIDCNQDSSCSVSLEMINKENEEEHCGKIKANRNVSTWKPTLAMINEK
ncbi:hypothetical protein EJD97_013900 [Solanum chilense]|uniref:Uncharacterized protein n=1 Tax=Solanum chilense TaxID=4083 RepID=A0A6N2AGQ9_SOLCI|nr:hypothetical protein EJD97_013900 [Solanum chilense]